MKRKPLIYIAIIFSTATSILLGILANLLFSSDAKLSLLTYGVLIASTVLTLGLAVLQLVPTWFNWHLPESRNIDTITTQQIPESRNTDAITIELEGKKIVAQNLSSKDAEKLIELFQTLQEGHFAFVKEETPDDKKKAVASGSESDSSTAISDTAVKEE